MNDLNSPAPPPRAANRPITPAPVAGDSTAHGQTPRQSDGQAPPPQQEANPNPAVTLAASLAGMSAGTLVEAMVVGADPDGAPVIQAAGGTFLAVMKGAIPAHTALTLQIQSTDTEIRALITRQNGEVRQPPTEVRLLLTNIGGASAGPGQTAATYGPPKGSPAGTPPHNAPSTGQPLVPGLRLSARVIATPSTLAARASGGGGALDPRRFPSAASTLRPGLPLLVRILAVGPQGTRAAPGAEASAPGGAAQGGIHSAAAGPSQVQGSTPPPTGAQTPQAQTGSPDQPAAKGAQPAPRIVARQAGAPDPARARGAEAPAAPPSASAVPSAASATAPQMGAPQVGEPVPAQPVTIAGVISGRSPEGQTLVRTAAGTIQLEATLAADDGTEVTLEALQPAAPFQGTANAAPSSPQAALVDFAAGWSALRELVQIVQASDPGVARQFVNQRIPSLNARSASNVLFFISALRGGDVQGWLGGDMSRAAERAGQRRLIDRLTDDFAQLRTLIDADGDDEWRALPFPFFDGEQIEPIMMFVRGRRAKKEEEEDDVRFVVDLELSALGAMQLDGLVQSESFDLIVRSKQRLGTQMTQDIRTLFESGLETTGLKGKIVFQTMAIFPVSPFGDFVGPENTAGEIVA